MPLPVLPTNIKIGWKGLQGTNALACYENSQITAVKSLIGLTYGLTEQQNFYSSFLSFFVFDMNFGRLGWFDEIHRLELQLDIAFWFADTYNVISKILHNSLCWHGAEWQTAEWQTAEWQIAEWQTGKWHIAEWQTGKWHIAEWQTAEW
jgi:hypothetical protein